MVWGTPNVFCHRRPIGQVMSDLPSLVWSVLLPVYEPGPYLEQTLRAFLAQDPGADRMQIEVVDDASLSQADH